MHSAHILSFNPRTTPPALQTWRWRLGNGKGSPLPQVAELSDGRTGCPSCPSSLPPPRRAHRERPPPRAPRTWSLDPLGALPKLAGGGGGSGCTVSPSLRRNLAAKFHLRGEPWSVEISKHFISRVDGPFLTVPTKFVRFSSFVLERCLSPLFTRHFCSETRTPLPLGLAEVWAPPTWWERCVRGGGRLLPPSQPPFPDWPERCCAGPSGPKQLPSMHPSSSHLAHFAAFTSPHGGSN